MAALGARRTLQQLQEACRGSFNSGIGVLLRYMSRPIQRGGALVAIAMQKDARACVGDMLACSRAVIDAGARTVLGASSASDADCIAGMLTLTRGGTRR